jgi:hypothetical protein
MDATYANDGISFVNCTPHAIVISDNDGSDDATFPPSGIVARVSNEFKFSTVVGGYLVSTVETGAITGLPDPVEKTYHIVSAMVLEANNRLPEPRTDLLAPATGHPQTIRDAKGHIVSVGGFVR